MERRAKLKLTRDAARERADRLLPTSADDLEYEASWDELSLTAQRALVRANILSVTIHPGRGAERVRIELVGE